MYKILKKTVLNESIRIIEIEAVDIAKNASAGQFIIIRTGENHERLPFTIFDKTNNSISILYQIVGSGTKLLDQLNENDYILDVAGPLGNPTDIKNIKKAIVVGGGVGCGVAFPLVKALYENQINVTAITGFRNKDFVILEDLFKEYTNNLYITTDDGSYKRKGLVTDVLNDLLEKNQYDIVYAIGPLIMMKYVCQVTKRYNIPTIVSLNPIMIDGTGMCGGCRVSVDGKMKFACVDGPDFDGHLVDFDLAISRNKSYLDFEKHKYEETCNLFKGDKHE
ncbi:MAG: sulfide/dihydroorotate dehydrogenase-like FAD/NAD-binding protein [Bacilli bacterium]